MHGKDLTDIGRQKEIADLKKSLDEERALRLFYEQVGSLL